MDTIIFYKIGYYSIFIIPIYTTFYIYYTQDIMMLPYYVICWGFNHIVNTIIKYIIKQPRPINQLNIIKDDSKYDPYGMPSGHAQHVQYTFSFLFQFADIYIVTLTCFLTLMAIVQRIDYRKHTINQVFVGCLVGSSIGSCAYLLYENSNKILDVNKYEYF